MGSNPDQGKVSFSLSLRIVCTLSHTQCLLAQTFAGFTTCHMGGKSREITKNPCSAICEANTDIRAMCGEKEKKFHLDFEFVHLNKCGIDRAELNRDFFPLLNDAEFF